MTKPSAAPTVEAFYERNTGTFSYVVYEAPGGACAVVDPILCLITIRKLNVLVRKAQTK